MKVIKRDGTEQLFNLSKVQVAIISAMKEVYGTDHKWDGESLLVAQRVGSQISPFELGGNFITIEDIQDRVEKALMKNHPEVAKAYILYRNRRAELRSLKPDQNAVADYIHASKYAKYIPEKKRRETYLETVIRSRDMHIEKFPQLRLDIMNVFDFVHDKKVLPSMRSMQFGGTAIEQHNARMYNCSFTLIDRVRVFQEIFYLLLCGCGVGFSIQKQHVDKLSKIGKPDKKRILMHHIEDSIIGWADAIGLLFECYQNQMYFEPCYDLIRPKGAVLKTGGGRAPGHLPLKILIEKNLRPILDNAIGRKLRPIECHDIICHIAESVLAGGIRRSSLISLFGKDDEEMMSSKMPEHFNYHGLNTQRTMANNSVVFLRSETTKEEFMELMRINKETYGEPGFMFTNNLDHGTNPCGEIGIDPTIIIEMMAGNEELKTGFGFCNLCEINVAACKTEQEFYDAAKAAAFIGTLQASYTDFNYLGDVTKQIVERDALLGVGLVGIMDNPGIGLDTKILSSAAILIKKENVRVANIIGISKAVRCTTVKPSGTSSLELGCVGSGIHPHHAKRYFRRVTANSNEPIVQFFNRHNPHMIEKKSNGDLCITFPVEAPNNSIVMADLTAIEFMYNIFKVYGSWIKNGADESEPSHNISSTIIVADDEWESVLNYAWTNRNLIRAMSFFPKFGDKKIPFIPREEVTKEDEAKWRFLIENYDPINYELLVEEQDMTSHTNSVACAGGACDVVHTDMISYADGVIYLTNPRTVDNKYLFKVIPMILGSIEVWEARYAK